MKQTLLWLLFKSKLNIQVKSRNTPAKNRNILSEPSQGIVYIYPNKKFAFVQNIRSAMYSNIHEGRNIKSFREMLSMKEEALAIDLDED